MTRRRCVLAMALLLSAAVRPARAAPPPTDLAGLFADALAQAWPRGRLPVGAGMTVADDPFVLTAAHVIAGCRHVQVARGHGLRPMALVGLDSRLDLALLRDAAAGPGVASRLAEAMATGPQWTRPSPARLEVVGFGQPLHDAGDPVRIAVQLSGLVQGLAEGPVLELSGALVPGDSGSPVLYEDGRSIGMVVGRLRADRSWGIAVRGEDVLRFLAYFGFGPSPRPGPAAPDTHGRRSAEGVMVQCTG